MTSRWAIVGRMVMGRRLHLYDTLAYSVFTGRGAGYCDQFACVSVCLSVCDHVSGTAGPIFTIFCADSLWPWLRPPVAALRYVMYTSGFMDDVTMGRNGPYGDG